MAYYNERGEELTVEGRKVQDDGLTERERYTAYFRRFAEDAQQLTDDTEMPYQAALAFVGVNMVLSTVSAWLHDQRVWLEENLGGDEPWQQ